VALSANGIKDKPKFGEVFALNPATVNITRMAMQSFVACLLTDEDKVPVSYATEATVGVLRQVGLAALQLQGEDNTPIANELMKAIHLLLSEKAPCQLRMEGDDQDEDDEDDHDNLVMDAVTDLVGELAKVLGPNFVVYFDEFQKLLLKFTKPSRVHTDRSMAIGCYAEVIAEIGPAALKYVDVLMPMLQAGLADPMEAVRRNSAFCVGTLVQSTGATLAPHFLSLLQWLHPVCLRKDSRTTSDTGGADVDNALASVARMITAARASVPLEHVLPVVLSSLPLREDTSEGPTIYQCLAQLLHENDATALSMVGPIVAAFGETLTKASTAEEKTKAISREMLVHLKNSSQFNAVVMAYVAQVTNPEDSQALQLALQ
jgi:importin-4